MPAPIIESYAAIRLHNRSDNCWAVVGDRTGAILVEGRNLMMRLMRDDALKIAENASRAARLATAQPTIGTLSRLQ